MDESLAIHNKNVWAGKNPGGATVTEARRRYAKEGIRMLLPLLSDLYSFRSDTKCRTEFIQRSTELLKATPLLVTKEPHITRGPKPLMPFSDWPKRIDMVTTYLAYYGKCPEFTQEERDFFSSVARQSCKEALPLLRTFLHTDQAHSYYLTLLTYVSLLDDSWEKFKLLNECAENAANNPKVQGEQRARIFIKLGLLLRKYTSDLNDHDTLWRGIGWGIRGCLVRGVPLNVRMKGVAALLHYER